VGVVVCSIPLEKMEVLGEEAEAFLLDRRVWEVLEILLVPHHHKEIMAALALLVVHQIVDQRAVVAVHLR
jgi:hypothetical protein